jgi:hypothetical protein
MSDEETPAATAEATDTGAKTEQPADTKDDTPSEPSYTQADLDRRISAALKKQGDNTERKAEEQRKQDEQIAAVKDGRFEDALTATRAELDTMKAAMAQDNHKSEAQSVLIKLGLTEFADSIIPNTQTIDDVIQMAEAMKKAVDEKAEEEVKRRLDTSTGRVPLNPTTPEKKTLDQMDKDEFKQFKIDHNLV